jgi:uncharacterized protein YfcZ (UPF0381/DUF406 family)
LAYVFIPGTIADGFHPPSWSMDSEGMHDRIRELCAKVVMADASEIEPVITELRAALRDHARFLRNMAAESLIPNLPFSS